MGRRIKGTRGRGQMDIFRSVPKLIIQNPKWCRYYLIPVPEAFNFFYFLSILCLYFPLDITFTWFYHIAYSFSFCPFTARTCQSYFTWFYLIAFSFSFCPSSVCTRQSAGRGLSAPAYSPRYPLAVGSPPHPWKRITA